MTQLADMVRGLAEREGVRTVVVASPDGLPIAQQGGAGMDAEALAALAATVAQHAERLGTAAECGDTRTIVVEYGDGTVVLAHAGEGNWIVLLVSPDLNLGPLLYDLRRHRPALADLL